MRPTKAPKPRNVQPQVRLVKRILQRAEIGRLDEHRSSAAGHIHQMSALTGKEPGRGGLVTLKDSGWVLLSLFHQPEIIGQPPGTSVWWGYGLYPDRIGDFVRKRMDRCSGAEILEETLQHLRFDRHLVAVMASSICVPCNMPYVNNIWLPRNRGDRPPSVPEKSTNLGLIGQYVAVPREIAFTVECSVRSAWEAIYVLLKRGPRRRPFIRVSTIRRTDAELSDFYADSLRRLA
jgi:oleate hydratase